MKKTLSILLCVCAFPAFAAAQTITINGIGLTGNVKAGEDFATRAFQDPWDMNQRTDVGWWLNGTDQPVSSLTNVSFANGIFSARSTTNDPLFFVVDSGYGGTAPVGKIGTNFPVNADLYKLFSVRMKVTNPSVFQLFWTENTIHDSPAEAGSSVVGTNAGWGIYVVNLALLGGTVPWSGTKRSLRLDPTARADEDMQFDWIRLAQIDNTLSRAINWSPAATAVDIYLDSADQTPNSDATKTLGLLKKGATGGVFPFNLGALPPGTYYVAMRSAGTTGPLTYYPTPYVINAPPLVTVTSPTPEGSSDDFATTQLNNSWDMTSLTDIDRMFNISGAAIRSDIPLVDLNDNAIANPTVFYGVSTPANPLNPTVGDPIPYLMAPDLRGFNYRIDPNRYRILTVDMGIPNLPRSYSLGSHARVIWHVAGEPPESENVSLPEVLNHRAGVNNLFSFSVDMKTLPIEPVGSPSQTGWNPGVSSRPGIDGFRVDPHEFPDPTAFYFKRVKLAALEKANTTYTIRWTTTKAAGTINLYWDDDRDPSNGKTLIGGPVAVTGLSGSAPWDTTPIPQGSEVYVYVEHDDGRNTNGVYGRWPVLIDHAPGGSARLVLNRSTLNFGVVQRVNQNFPLIGTSTQTVRVSVAGGSACWAVDNGLPATYTITIEGGAASKCGSGFFTVALNPSNPFNVVGLGEATFTVRELTPGTTSNSPQFVHAFQRITNGPLPPFGVVDTPADGMPVSGSIPVTGWAVDDIDISAVSVYRDSVPGEAAGLVFIGNAVRVDDARPDVEAGNLAPFNYRGGWGYLMLTNFLPNGGNGNFTLRVYAVDVEGQQTLLGSRTIAGVNSSAQEPFGAIDSPLQGEVVSGTLTSYNNFGWVLAAGNVKASPALSAAASVTVYIDGVAAGSPSLWTSRSDLTALFPQIAYSGITHALGVFSFNPSALANGVHTIAWGVTASNGLSAGVGSRYFTIAGGASLTLGSTSGAITGATRLDTGPDLGRRTASIGAIAADGPKTVLGRELQRLVIDASRAGTGTYDAYLSANGRLVPLPIGASFDPSRGVLYWQPGIGFTGAYDFVVVRDGRERVPVRVVLQPQRPSARGLR